MAAGVSRRTIGAPMAFAKAIAGVGLTMWSSGETTTSNFAWTRLVSSASVVEYSAGISRPMMASRWRIASQAVSAQPFSSALVLVRKVEKSPGGVMARDRRGEGDVHRIDFVEDGETAGHRFGAVAVFPFGIEFERVDLTGPQQLVVGSGLRRGRPWARRRP